MGEGGGGGGGEFKGCHWRYATYFKLLAETNRARQADKFWEHFSVANIFVQLDLLNWKKELELISRSR